MLGVMCCAPFIASTSPESVMLIKPSDITQREVYEGRRAFLARIAAGAAVGSSLWEMANREALAQGAPAQKLAATRNAGFSTAEPQTSFQDATHYNNFYEFGTDKGDPAENAHTLRTRPWTVRIDGEVHKPQVVDVDQLLGWFPLEERIYRMRCVEAWSMVIPWVGFPLGDLLKRVEPTSRARYVAFTALLDPEQMPGQRRRIL